MKPIQTGSLVAIHNHVGLTYGVVEKTTSNHLGQHCYKVGDQTYCDDPIYHSYVSKCLAPLDYCTVRTWDDTSREYQYDIARVIAIYPVPGFKTAEIEVEIWHGLGRQWVRLENRFNYHCDVINNRQGWWEPIPTHLSMVKYV